MRFTVVIAPTPSKSVPGRARNFLAPNPSLLKTPASISAVEFVLSLLQSRNKSGFAKTSF
jgi:hypothetical protein